MQKLINTAFFGLIILIIFLPLLFTLNFTFNYINTDGTQDDESYETVIE